MSYDILEYPGKISQPYFHNDVNFRDREARAAKLAREIEGTTSSHLAAELENGDDDEENAFSAVVRDPNQSKPI